MTKMMNRFSVGQKAVGQISFRIISLAAPITISRSMQSSSDRGLGLPDSVLTELWRAEISPETFAAALSAFGRLPEEAQYDFAVRLAKPVAIYRLRKTIEKQKFPPAHKMRRYMA
jgi:hypothetical protein